MSICTFLPSVSYIVISLSGETNHTLKKFYVVLYLCKVKSVADLVAVVSTRQRIPKESVISESEFPPPPLGAI